MCSWACVFVVYIFCLSCEPRRGFRRRNCSALVGPMMQNKIELGVVGIYDAPQRMNLFLKLGKCHSPCGRWSQDQPIWTYVRPRPGYIGPGTVRDALRRLTSSWPAMMRVFTN
jgi:hypothetical protein